MTPEEPLRGLAWRAGELALVWIVAAGARRVALGPLLPVGGLLGHSPTAWLVAAPLAGLVQARFLARTVIPTVFLETVLGLSGTFLPGRRLFLALVCRWLGQKRRE